VADLGTWAPLAPDDVRMLLADAPFAWWLAGGWSLDLLTGHQTRPHADTDVQVMRRDLAAVRSWFGAWDPHVADPPGAGTLRPWRPDEVLGAALHDVWCRQVETGPWRVQLMVADADGTDWVYRRDRRVRRPLDSLAGRASGPGLPVLAPEVQLLYKSTGRRDKDREDFDRFEPLMSDAEAAWLRDALALAEPAHPWTSRLAARTGG
jgi:hypothetical protein